MLIDFLDLQDKDFEKTQLVVFFGVSGGGKSTYLNYFNNIYKRNLFLFHKDKTIAYEKTDLKYIFIDEIVYISQLYIVVRYLLAGKKVFVATHLPLVLYKMFFIFNSKELFSTEKNSEKIILYLSSKNIKSDKKTVKLFMKKYKGSFKMIDEILRNYPKEEDFSTIYDSFHRDCTVIIKNNY